MKRIILLISLLSSLCISFTVRANNLTETPELKDFIKHMVTQYQFNEASLTSLFEHVHINHIAQKRTKHPFEQVPWLIYKTHFLNPYRVKGGIHFWKQHAQTLKRAEQQYGVPASIIVAILGVETKFGERKGHIPTIDALSTLAFNHSTRSHFFKSELQEFLLLCREQSFDPLHLKGSYAGALGWPQFMPSNYRRYAVDFNKDHKIDIMNDPVDAIGSVAHFLLLKGWKKGQPVAKRLKHVTPSPQKQMKGILQLGVIHPEYWRPFHNFHVLAKYNPNKKYVMAVYQLSEKLRHQYEKEHKQSHKNKPH